MPTTKETACGLCVKPKTLNQACTVVKLKGLLWNFKIKVPEVIREGGFKDWVLRFLIVCLGGTGFLRSKDSGGRLIDHDSTAMLSLTFVDNTQACRTSLIAMTAKRHADSTSEKPRS